MKKKKGKGKDTRKEYMKRYSNLIVGKTFYNMTLTLEAIE